MTPATTGPTLRPIRSFAIVHNFVTAYTVTHVPEIRFLRIFLNLKSTLVQKIEPI